MKLFKIIVNCVIVTLLFLSITLSTIILVKEDAIESEVVKEPVQEYDCDHTSVTNNDNTVVAILTHATVTIENSIPAIEDLPPAAVIEEELAEEDTLFYQDSNITVAYVGYEDKETGPVLYFKIKNTSDKPVNVLFTDVYLDGCEVYVSGLKCLNLEAGEESTDQFILYQKDGVDIFNVDTVSFIIKLTSAKSYLDLYESERMSITFK